MTPAGLAALKAAILALNAFYEARGEPDDGVAAVCKVTLNRAALRYQSDGTVWGSVTHDAAFSWTDFDMVDGRYTRVVHTPAEQLARLEHCLGLARADGPQWARCERIASQVQAGAYHSPLFDRLGSDAVLYYAPAACAAPAWARPLAFIVQIGRQRFYRDISHGLSAPPVRVASAAPSTNYGAAGTAKALEA